ncbi:MAG: hypothetical protein K8F91_01755 [Candidatus Obscuribacterales bacterium]|nr:hypothetical protein [Candidatus Obscuribacterales bacterium]
MSQTSTASLTERLRAIENEPESVCNQRNSLLVARAQAEILLLRMFATFDPENSESQEDPNAAFEDVCQALNAQVDALQAAVDQFDDLTVASSASEDALALIGVELDEHVRRIGELRCCLAQLDPRYS